MQSITVPNTDPARDHAFQLDTGETVVVNVTRAAQANPGDSVTIVIQARMVDPATGDTLTVGSSPVVCDPHAATILSSALGDGSVDVATVVANHIATQAQRPRALKAALTSLASIAPAAAT